MDERIDGRGDCRKCVEGREAAMISKQGENDSRELIEEKRTSGSYPVGIQ